MPAVEVKIVNRSTNELPAYATTGSSGMDIRAFLDLPKVLQPLERALIPTGIFIELPEGCEVQVRPRSGLAARHGITCLNTPGTILINLSAEEQVINPGDRIAQMVIQKVKKMIWKPVEELAVTDRNAGGFGHTGKQ